MFAGDEAKREAEPSALPFADEGLAPSPGGGTNEMCGVSLVVAVAVEVEDAAIRASAALAGAGSAGAVRSARAATPTTPSTRSAPAPAISFRDFLRGSGSVTNVAKP